MLKHYVAWLLAGALMASFATARAESEWTPSTYRLQIDMMAIGYSEKLSAVIIQSCKDTALDPRHCVITAGFIGFNESSAGNAKNGNNIFGFRGQRYAHPYEAVWEWISEYNEHWYKTAGPIDFYSPNKNVPKTAYCVDEYQKNGKKLHYCPNGYRNASKAYHILIQSK